MYLFLLCVKKCLYINHDTPMHHGGVGAEGCAWRLVLCCHVLFQKVFLRASLCRNGLNLGAILHGRAGMVRGYLGFGGRILRHAGCREEGI